MRVKLEEVCKRIYAGGDVPKDRYSTERTDKYCVPIYANAEKDAGLYGYTDEARETELSITVAARGTIGYAAIRKEPFLPVVRLITVVPDLTKVSERYLFYALRNCKPQSSGTSIPQLTVPDIKKNYLNLLELPEQERIADRLDQIKNIIELREEEIKELDNLIKARFVELFGDPVNNSKSFVKEELSNVCTKITDGTHDTPERYSEGFLLITGKNIRASGIIYDDVEYVSEEDHKVIYARCNPEYEDVLYTNIGVNYGTACLNDLQYEFSMKNVALLKPDRSRINGYYLWICLNLMRDYILRMNQVGGAQTFMGLATIKKIVIPIPPIELQNSFIDFIKQVDNSKKRVKEAQDETQTLLDSLMQEYFG